MAGDCKQEAAESKRHAVRGLKVASATHEVKNFAESLTSLVYLLQKNPKLDDDSRKYVQLIENELERMRYVITETLERYHHIANPNPVSLPKVLDTVLQFCGDKIVAKNVQVEKRYEYSGMLNLDFEDLRQIFSNLVVNAVQALRRSGRLVVHIFRSRNAEGEGVRVVVADNGVGIPAEHHNKVFRQSFTTKGSKGTGLGLSLTAKTIQERGGTIRFRSSTKKGRSGTTFLVFLPLSSYREPVPSKSGSAGKPIPLPKSEHNLPVYAQTPALTPSENRAIARKLRAENYRLLMEIRAHHERFNLFKGKRTG